MASVYLKDPAIAALVQDSLLKYDDERYRLFAWCVMPNHEHALLTRTEDYELGDIMQAHKSFTAHQANKLLKRKGRFWMPEPFDRHIRNAETLLESVALHRKQPGEGRLVQEAERLAI